MKNFKQICPRSSQNVKTVVEKTLSEDLTNQKVMLRWLGRDSEDSAGVNMATAQLQGVCVPFLKF